MAETNPDTPSAGKTGLLREPLLHFLLAGGLLFAAYAWLNRAADGSEGSAARTVRITASEVDWLRASWSRQWRRAPDENELKGIVQAHLREELLAREARALKLDENDTVVRRRLAQKMEFVVQDTAQLGEPDEAELRRLYDAQRERFLSPARISFSHIYFSRERRGARAEADARAALQRLAQGAAAAADPAQLGDRFLAEYDFVDADAQAVAGVLGPAFARHVFALDAGAWQGPLESGYGLHLVRISDKQMSRARDFAEARGEVLTLWRRQREQALREEYFAALLARYDVVADESIRSLVAPLLTPKGLAN